MLGGRPPLWRACLRRFNTGPWRWRRFQLTKVRKDGSVPWLRPDGKTQVTVEYKKEGGAMIPLRVHTVLISTQHNEDVTNDQIHKVLPSQPQLKGASGPFFFFFLLLVQADQYWHLGACAGMHAVGQEGGHAIMEYRLIRTVAHHFVPGCLGASRSSGSGAECFLQQNCPEPGCSCSSTALSPAAPARHVAKACLRACSGPGCCRVLWRVSVFSGRTWKKSQSHDWLPCWRQVSALHMLLRIGALRSPSCRSLSWQSASRSDSRSLKSVGCRT